MGPPPNRPADLCEDRAWLDAFRAGQPAALERVFRTYGSYVLAIVRRGFVTRQGGAVQGVYDVEIQRELVQEVFVRALSPSLREKYDGLRPYAVYLRAVVGNVMLEDARRRTAQLARSAGREATDGDMQDAAAWTPGQPLPDQAAISQEETTLVRAYLATLTPEMRQFVELRFQEGASQRDAADALGLGRQTVRTLEKSVRDGLKKFAAGWTRKKDPVPNPEV